MNNKEIINKFHELYYNSEVWRNTFWFGTSAKKCPLDLWIYQEIIFEVRPDIIIECGTGYGGTALYLANICQLLQKGRIISIDIKPNDSRPAHPRIDYLLGSSTDDNIVRKVRGLIKDKLRVMVILDSDHTKQHVLDELRIYSNFVDRDNYLIVEDTNLNGNPVMKDFGESPKDAVEEFMKGNKNFVIDTKREKFYLTFNPKGFLRKK